MGEFRTLVASEWKMQWRSPGAWAVGLLGVLYGVGGAVRQETFLGVAYDVGASLAAILPVGLALVWITAAHRSSRCGAGDLLDSTPLSPAIRRSAEAAGSLLVGMCMAGIAAAGSIAGYMLAAPRGSRGVASDLWLLGLIAAPVLLAWLSLSRLLARALAPGAAYLAAALIWAWGLWARTPLVTLSYIPREERPSEAMLLALAGGRELLLHRTVLVVLGVVLGAVAVGPLSGHRREAVKVVAGILVAAVGVSLLAAPGAVAVLGTPPMPGPLEAWVDAATAGGRWAEIRGNEGVAYVPHAYAPWAGEALAVLERLAATEDVAPRSLVVVVAPRSALERNGSTILLPERAFARVDSRTVLVRRLVTYWVAHQVSKQGAQRERPPTPPATWAGVVEEIVEDGVRLYLEWRYVADLLGPKVAAAEVAAWSASLERRASWKTWDRLLASRGVPNRWEEAIRVAQALWDELHDPPVGQVLAGYSAMSRALARQPADLAPDEAVLRAMQEALRQQAGSGP